MNVQSGGLYHPDEFRDNCGFGLIAHMEGKASHNLLQTAIEALTCMTHRGAIAADGKTGDGCGLLIKMPETFFRAIAKETFGQDLASRFGVGMVFLSQDATRAAQAREVLEREVAGQGLTVVGWRVVPTDPSVCGRIALSSLPQIEQIFVNGDAMSGVELNRRLFFARRLAEAKLKEDRAFYVSIPSATIGAYKSLFFPNDFFSLLP